MMFHFFITPTRKSDTAFSKFIREASSEDKKRVYNDVIAKATKRQTRLMEQAAKQREELGLRHG